MILMILPDMSTEEVLLKRLRQGGGKTAGGDPEAVIAVYEQYFPPLYQYARLKVGDASVAEDIVSDVFVILIESLGTRSAPRKNLRGWLFTVARNEIYRSYGKVRHLPLADVEEWMPAPSEHHPEKQATLRFDMERVRHALRMLTADHQEVLILRFGQQMPIKDTADVMGKSVSAIKSLQFRALETLRGILVEKETAHD
jgi:RNA polymerase sigma-70 factor, ECF subfamily